MYFEYVLAEDRIRIPGGGEVDVLYVYVTRIAKLGWGLRREAVLPQVEQIVLGDQILFITRVVSRISILIDSLHHANIWRFLSEIDNCISIPNTTLLVL